MVVGQVCDHPTQPAHQAGRGGMMGQGKYSTESPTRSNQQAHYRPKRRGVGRPFLRWGVVNNAANCQRKEGDCLYRVLEV